jgi:hypothetical protein
MCYDIACKPPKLLLDYLPYLDGVPLKDDFYSDQVVGHGYPDYPIVYQRGNQLICRPMEWRVIPFYVKNENAFARQRPSMLNARAERIFDD